MNESIFSLLVVILLEIAMSTMIYWSHRRLDIRRFSDAVWMVVNQVGFLVTGYGILGYLGPSFPGQFSFVELVFIASGIALGCLLLGYWLELLFSRSNWWSGDDVRSRYRRGKQRKP